MQRVPWNLPDLNMLAWTVNCHTVMQTNRMQNYIDYLERVVSVKVITVLLAEKERNTGTRMTAKLHLEVSTFDKFIALD